MGVQSFHETLLEKLGRIHTREMVFKSFDRLRHAGFENVNLDLMFAIPGQTLEIWRDTLDEAIVLGSEHLSSYEVIYEEDTPLYHQLQAGEFSVDEDLASAMYDELLSRTAASGFVQYEIANFARRNGRQPGDACAATPPSNAGDSTTLPERACRHNVNYWRGGSFYGLGPSAAGYVRGVRTKNWSNTTLYCERLEEGKRAIESAEELAPLRRAGEIAAFGLRMNAGWPLRQFHQTTGFDLRREWTGEIDQLVARKWAELDSDRFHLTSQGLRFADAAAEMFLK
jgi:oxygen-independent coproporphyrinogen-3 oxidase